MDPEATPAFRFDAARERAGLSVADVAQRAGTTEASVWDLESYDDELICACSLAELQVFAAILGVTPSSLLGTAENVEPMSNFELGATILAQSQEFGQSIGPLAETTGWDIGSLLQDPQNFSRNISLEGIRDICLALGLDWERFVSGAEKSK